MKISENSLFSLDWSEFSYDNEEKPLKREVVILYVGKGKNYKNRNRRGII